MAGFDTSGHTATWVLFLVSQHPEARLSPEQWGSKRVLWCQAWLCSDRTSHAAIIKQGGVASGVGNL